IAGKQELYQERYGIRSVKPDFSDVATLRIPTLSIFKPRLRVRAAPDFLVDGRIEPSQHLAVFFHELVEPVEPTLEFFHGRRIGHADVVIGAERLAGNNRDVQAGLLEQLVGKFEW